MFNFLKKSVPQTVSNLTYETVQVDMHSHVLPGIDDGAQTPDDSIVLIKRMMGMGIKKIIATPHVMADYYKNTPETIGNALTILKARLLEEKIDIVIEAAAEHYFDESFEPRIDNGQLFSMVNNYVLFEFSFISKPPNAVPAIQKMNDKGFKPILAHPERYPYLDLEQLKNYTRWGCDLQLNTISLTGYYGKEVKKRAEELVDNQMISFISSDMHHVRHADALQAALKTPYLEKVLMDYPLKNTLLL